MSIIFFDPFIDKLEGNEPDEPNHRSKFLEFINRPPDAIAGIVWLYGSGMTVLAPNNTIVDTTC
eukprot:1491383-Amphidinium_carterae.1